jgi:hypothetical protein
MAFLGKIFQSSEPESKKTPQQPSKPKTLFEEKKDWKRSEFLRKASQNHYRYKEPSGRTVSVYEEKKILEEAFPQERFGSYLSENEAKKRLRELRSEEYRAKTWDEKKRLAKLREYLEKETGLKGKY